MATEESIATHVFRWRIKLGDDEIGQVGFDREDGVDVLRIVSWKDGQTVGAEFPVEAAPLLVEIIQRAYDTRTRPNDHSCFAFEKPSTQP